MPCFYLLDDIYNNMLIITTSLGKNKDYESYIIKAAKSLKLFAKFFLGSFYLWAI